MRKINSFKFLVNIVGFSAASWISAVLSFVVLPISTRIFLPEDLAKINLFYSILTMVMSLACLGLDQGYIRFYNERETETDKKKLLSACLMTGIIVLVIIMVCAIPISKYIRILIYGENQNMVIIPLFFCVLNMLSYRYISLLYRMENNILSYTIVAVVSSTMIKMSYLLAAFYRANYITAIYLMTLISIIFFIILMVICRSQISIKTKIKSVLDKSILMFSLPLLPLGFMTQLNNYMPQFAIRSQGLFNELGVFSSAVTLAAIITLLQSGLNIFWSPYIFKNYQLKEKEIKKMQKVITFVMISFAILILMFKDILVLILGPNYKNSIIYIPFLLLSPVCYTIAETTGIGILIEKKSYLNVIAYGICILINIILSFGFANIFGTIGASIAAGLTALILLLLRTIFGQKYYHSIQNNKIFILQILVLCITSTLNIVIIDKKVLSFLLNIALIFILFLVSFANDLLKFVIAHIGWQKK